MAGRGCNLRESLRPADRTEGTCHEAKNCTNTTLTIANPAVAALPCPARAPVSEQLACANVKARAKGATATHA